MYHRCDERQCMQCQCWSIIVGSLTCNIGVMKDSPCSVSLGQSLLVDLCIQYMYNRCDEIGQSMQCQ